MPDRLPDKLARLLAYHENAVAHIRAVMAFLDHDEPGLFRSGRLKNGHTSPVLRDALALDEQRRSRSTPGPKPKGQRTHTSALIAKRTATADLLNRFNETTPVPLAEIAAQPGKSRRILGSLVRRGYLKHTKHGYLRTSKAFYVNPRDARAASR